MNRAQKDEFIQQFSKDMKESEAVALLSFSGITVEKMTEFRLSLRKSNVRARVVKNTLARRVLGEEHPEVLDHLKGVTMVAFGKDDAVQTAKAVWDWVKKEDFNMDLKSGIALGKVVDKGEMERLSTLPGREDMLVLFLWALKHHPTRFLYALKDKPQQLGYALGALKKKKEEESN